MNSPELSVLHSETIAAELAFRRLELAPSGEHLAALTDRLGLKTPSALTVALIHPGDQVLFTGGESTEDAAKADAGSVGMEDLTVFPEGALPVAIRELSERNILRSFARSLAGQGRFNQRMKVLKWGSIALMAELGVGTVASTTLGPGLNWGFLGIPAAALTGAGLWVWYRGWRNNPLVIPNLDGLESPIRIVERMPD